MQHKIKLKKEVEVFYLKEINFHTSNMKSIEKKKDLGRKLRLRLPVGNRNQYLNALMKWKKTKTHSQVIGSKWMYFNFNELCQYYHLMSNGAPIISKCEQNLGDSVAKMMWWNWSPHKEYYYNESTKTLVKINGLRKC